MNPQYPLVFSTLLIRLGVGIMVTHIVMSMAYHPIIVDWQIAIFSLGSYPAWGTHKHGAPWDT